MPHLRQALTLVLSTPVLSKKILSALSVLQLSWTTVRAVHRCSLRHSWDMSHVVSRTSNLISQYLQAPKSSSIFKLIILQHNLLHGGRSNSPLNSNWASYIIGSTVHMTRPREVWNVVNRGQIIVSARTKLPERIAVRVTRNRPYTDSEFRKCYF